MQVRKRNGQLQEVDFEKIHWRIKSMCSQEEILKFQEKERQDAYKVFSCLPPLSVSKTDIDMIAKKTIDGIYNGISTSQIDILSAEIAQDMSIMNPENGIIASRILVSNMQKNILEIIQRRFPHIKITSENLFRYVMEALYFNRDQNGELAPLVAPYILAIAVKYIDKIHIDFSRDFLNHDYLGIKTLERGYLFKVHSMDRFTERDILLETPGIADMRVALGITCAPIPCPNVYEKNHVLGFLSTHAQDVMKEKALNSDGRIEVDVWNELSTLEEPHYSKFVDIKRFKEKYWLDQLEKAIENTEISNKTFERIYELYDGMSMGKFTPATPTRFAAGTLKPQCSSCFLIAMEDDSLKGIYNTLKEQSQISKHAGGVAIWVHNIRSNKSYISGTNGHSNGLKPMLKVFDASASYVDQGGKREGSVAIYCEIWHPDIIDFIRLKRKKGAESDRARRLFYALWIADEFWRCLKENVDWYLFDPSVCPKLYQCYDECASETYLSDEYVKANKQKFLFTYRYRKYIGEKKYVNKISPYTIMEEIVETVKESGVPYMASKDACNRKSNQKNIGIINSSNLCVAPYTKILTKEGYKIISELENVSVEIWNGFEWSTTTIKLTGKNKELLRVKLSNGSVLDCTPEHNFYINQKYYNCSDEEAITNRNITKIVPAKALKCGDKLIKHRLPSVSDCPNSFLNINNAMCGKSCYIKHNFAEQCYFRNRNTKQTEFVTVISVENLPGIYDTYCCTEEKRNLATFEGIVTGQCMEILEVSNEKETAVCNLSSICLNKFVRPFKHGDVFKYNVSLKEEKEEYYTFDFDDFGNTVSVIQKYLDRIIDINYYPTEKGRKSNFSARPQGIGLQGEADMLAMLRLPWSSKEAQHLRFYIMERMYYEALKSSMELAKEYGPYDYFRGSPASQGLLQFDLCKIEGRKISFALSLPWDGLKEDIQKYGLRNSLCIALMPTASTSNIMGNSPSIEPFNSLIYVKKSNIADISIINKTLVKDLKEIGLWNQNLRNKILNNHGSIQDILEIPKKIRDSYLTVYDLEPEHIIDAAFVRSWFVDQSQSMNLFLKNITISSLTKAWTRGWMRGLKTLSYYIRSRTATTSQKAQLENNKTTENIEGEICSRDNPNCLSCGS